MNSFPGSPDRAHNASDTGVLERRPGSGANGVGPKDDTIGRRHPAKKNWRPWGAFGQKEGRHAAPETSRTHLHSGKATGMLNRAEY
jgi:hypothetical protein